MFTYASTRRPLTVAPRRGQAPGHDRQRRAAV